MADLKVSVEVVAVFDRSGRLLPKSLTWENGHQYLIDRVVAISPAAALKAGGQGDRYTIRISGQQSYLFFA